MDDLHIRARNLIQKHLQIPRDEATAIAARMDDEAAWSVLDVADQVEGDFGGRIRELITLPVPAWEGEGRRVRLRGDMNRPLGGGPNNGMYALQKALRVRELDWLVISGAATPNDLMWFWNWQDVGELIHWDSRGRPFVTGPNILFEWSRAPGAARGEKEILRSPNCRLIFTESEWYEQLIRRHRGAANTAPIVLWPYPIDPMPDGPLPAEYDLLIYAKSGPPGLAAELARRYDRCAVLQYGRFAREHLFDVARRSRACVYLSDDDRGPLALAEILLTGCPAVGIERGAPWVESGRTGLRVEKLDAEHICDAVEDLLEWDREAVRETALKIWETDRIVDVVVGALEAARRD